MYKRIERELTVNDIIINSLFTIIIVYILEEYYRFLVFILPLNCSKRKMSISETPLTLAPGFLRGTCYKQRVW